MRATFLRASWGVVFCTLLGTGASAAVGICSFYQDAYRNEIRPKIQGGVPFELMSVVIDDDHLVSKKAIRIVYNLWDEIVMLKSGEHVVARFALSNGEAELCKYLEISDELKAGHKYKFRILLNPMWAERMTRLQVASDHDTQGSKIVEINWQKLAGEMPSEKTLLEKELAR